MENEDSFGDLTFALFFCMDKRDSCKKSMEKNNLLPIGKEEDFFNEFYSKIKVNPPSDSDDYQQTMKIFKEVQEKFNSHTFSDQIDPDVNVQITILKQSEYMISEILKYITGKNDIDLELFFS